jgi:hypothetical protein
MIVEVRDARVKCLAKSCRIEAALFELAKNLGLEEAGEWV